MAVAHIIATFLSITICNLSLQTNIRRPVEALCSKPSPQSFELIDSYQHSPNPIYQFSQSNNSNEYCIVDDVVFSKDMRILIKYPPYKHGDAYQVPTLVEEIAPYAFYHSQLKCIVFHNIWDYDKQLVIGDYAFAESIKLDYIYLPYYITNQGKHVLYGCNNTLSVIVGKNSISYLALLQDSDVSNAQLVVISDELDMYAWIHAEWEINMYPEEIESGAYWVQDGVLFWGNDMICYPINKETSIYRVPSKVYNITSDSLLQNKNLLQLIIPTSCIFIDQSSLIQTADSKIEEIIVEEGNPTYQSIDGVLYTKNVAELLCYPSKRITGLYKVPEGVITLKDGCFRCSLVTKIVLPDSLLRIEYDVFTESSVVELNIPVNVQELNIESFEFCPNLANLIIIEDSYAQQWFSDIKEMIDFSGIIKILQ